MTGKNTAADGSDYAKPSLGLLVKLGSIAVHAREATSSDGHQFDLIALKGRAQGIEILPIQHPKPIFIVAPEVAHGTDSNLRRCLGNL